MVKVRLGDHLDFSTGATPPVRQPAGRFPVYGANGVIGYTGQRNASGPLIVLGRVGSYCGSVYYSDSDVWVTDNALVCRAVDPEETRFWYYLLQTCRLNEYRAGSGQPLLNQRILRDLAIWTVEASERAPIGEFLGALDDKTAASDRVIAAAEKLMLAIVESVIDYVPLSSLATRSMTLLSPDAFDDVVAHFSLPAFDQGAKPQVVAGTSVKSDKFVLSEPCVLFAKLNPSIPRIWNVVSLPAEMALASTEFVVLKPMGTDTSALWAAVRQHDVSETLQQKVMGTSGSRQRIQPRDLLELRVRDVRRLSADASRMITSLGALCQAHHAESVRLATFRDTLLPLLTSGQVKVRTSSLGSAPPAQARPPVPR